MKAALERHDALLQAAVEGSNGQVVKTTGDGLMAVFASPVDGVMACLQAQHSLQSEPWGETGSLRVRMGLHAGEAQPRGGDYFGPVVNRAARLMSTAHGGQVLLSAAAVSLVLDRLPPGAALRDLGERLGAGVLDEIFTGFGLTEQPVLPIAASANQTPVADPGLAAIGQDTLTITPLQAARAYAALAQEGMLPPLQLVEGLQDEEGRWQAATAGDVAGQSVAGAAARRVLASLSALGSSRELSVNALAGPRGGTNTWYVGLAPGGNPDTVVVLVLENEEDPATAAEIGREVLGLAAVGP